MVRINRKVEYALMALRFMSQRGQGVLSSAKEICAETHAPFDATSRVMQLMSQRGILKSEHGAHGGYQIVQDLNRVSLYDVMETILGPIEIVKCLNGQEDCELFNTCTIQSPLRDLNLRLKEFYEGLTLGELLKLKDRKPEVWATQRPKI
jgi:Rrf2 family transcriptional regulator, nitric oxide-sensitive transcriptional repressor